MTCSTERSSLGILLVMVVLLSACTPPVDQQTRMQIARDHEQRGDYVSAILELKNLLQVESSHMPALSMLGRLSLHAGRSAEAVDYLLRALELGAPPHEVWMPLGRAMLAQGRFEDVLADIDASAVPYYRRGEIHLLHAEALMSLGRLDEAELKFDEARSEASTLADALSGIAQIAILKRDFARAEKILGMAVERDPFSVTAHRMFGALRLAESRLEDALEAFVNAVEATRIRPGSDDLLLARVGLAETQWRIGQKSRALGNAKDLLDAYPWHPLPRYLRALLAYDSREYQLASEYLRAVLEIVPRHLPSQQLLAASEYELGNFASTELLLRDYLLARPDDVDMRKLHAQAHLRMGNPTGAMATLLAVVDHASDDAEYLALLGRTSLHTGDAASAADYLFRAVNADPLNDDIRNSLVVALIGSGQIKQAEYQLAALPESDESDSTRAILDLVLLMRKADNERAAQFAKDLRQVAPANLHAMLALAELAETRGDSTRAVEWLEMARSRNMDAVEPRLLLVRYYHRRGDHERAHDLAIEAVQIRPQQHDALIALAQEKLDLNQVALASRTYTEALRASPGSVAALIGLARCSAWQGQVAQAADYLDAVVSADAARMPRAAAVVLELAERGDHKNAEVLASRLQQAVSGLPQGYAVLGDMQMARQQFAQALSAYESASQYSDDPVLALKSFIAAREAGQAEPTRVLQKWIARHPDNKQVRRILASAENQP